MAWSAAQSVRNALQEWAQSLVGDLFSAATVAGGPLEPGQVPALPTLGLEWGSTRVEHSRPVDDDGLWLLHYEDVDLAFVWRANDLEQADLFAHTFAARAAAAAMASNDDGNRVLHFAVGDQAAKLYLDGAVTPVAADENLTRGLYTYRVPGAVSYPVVEAFAEDAALMNIVVVIGETAYDLEEIINA